MLVCGGYVCIGLIVIVASLFHCGDDLFLLFYWQQSGESSTQAATSIDCDTDGDCLLCYSYNVAFSIYGTQSLNRVESKLCEVKFLVQGYSETYTR